MGESSDFLSKILASGPSQNTIYMVLMKLKEQGRTTEVIRECLKALGPFPDDIRIRKLLAESYLEAGSIGLAEAELDRVTSEMDALNVVYKLQAQVLAKQERFGEALEPLNRYLALMPDDQEALDLLDQISPAEPEAETEEPPPVETAMPIEEVEPPKADTEPVTEAIEAEPAPAALESEAAPFEAPPIAEGAETAAEMAEGPEDKDIGVVEEDLEEAIADLATPTLAELYDEQGQIQEAITTYEKVIQNNPEDHASQERLAALKAQMEEKPMAEPEHAAPAPEDALRKGTEHTIAILENWRARIKTKSNA